MQWLILWLQKKSHLKIKKKCQMEVKLESSPNGEQSKRIHTDKELAKMAGVSTDTYSKGKKILDSDNERLKKEVLSGEIGGSAKKVGKRIKELVYGIQHEGDHGNQYTEAKPNNSDLPKSQSDLAAQMGISVDTLQNYKLLSEMIPELKENVAQENAKKFLDKLGKWCYDFINDKDYKSCQLQLSNK